MLFLPDNIAWLTSLWLIQQQLCGVTWEDFRAAETRVMPSAMREVALEVPNVRWTDIGGQDHVKQVLREGGAQQLPPFLLPAASRLPLLPAPSLPPLPPRLVTIPTSRSPSPVPLCPTSLSSSSAAITAWSFILPLLFSRHLHPLPSPRPPPPPPPVSTFSTPPPFLLLLLLLPFLPCLLV